MKRDGERDCKLNSGRHSGCPKALAGKQQRGQRVPERQRRLRSLLMWALSRRPLIGYARASSHPTQQDTLHGHKGKSPGSWLCSTARVKSVLKEGAASCSDRAPQTGRLPQKLTFSLSWWLKSPGLRRPQYRGVRGPSPRLVDALSCLCVWPSLCVCLCPSPPPHKDTSTAGSEPTPMTTAL